MGVQRRGALLREDVGYHRLHARLYDVSHRGLDALVQLQLHLGEEVRHAAAAVVVVLRVADADLMRLHLARKVVHLNEVP